MLLEHLPTKNNKYFFEILKKSQNNDSWVYTIMTTLQNDGDIAMFYIFFLSISGKQRDPYVDDIHWRHPEAQGRCQQVSQDPHPLYGTECQGHLHHTQGDPWSCQL